MIERSWALEEEDTQQILMRIEGRGISQSRRKYQGLLGRGRQCGFLEGPLLPLSHHKLVLRTYCVTGPALDTKETGQAPWIM